MGKKLGPGTWKAVSKNIKKNIGLSGDKPIFFKVILKKINLKTIIIKFIFF